MIHQRLLICFFIFFIIAGYTIQAAESWSKVVSWDSIESKEDSVENAFNADEIRFKNNLNAITLTGEKTYNGLTLPYRFFKPANYDPNKKYPLVLFLHGVGSSGTDNISNADLGFGVWTFDRNQSKQPMFVVSPQCPKGKQWVDQPFNGGAYSIDKMPISAAMKVVVAILDEFEQKYSIDKSRVYVTGQSMGGFGTWDILMRYPQRFAAAVPICGGGDPAQAQSLKSKSIWTFHGDIDGQVKYEGTRVTAQAIHDAGGPILFTTYAGAGHLIWGTVYRTQEVIDWLLSQRLDGSTDTKQHFSIVHKNVPVEYSSNGVQCNLLGRKFICSDHTIAHQVLINHYTGVKNVGQYIAGEQ